MFASREPSFSLGLWVKVHGEGHLLSLGDVLLLHPGLSRHYRLGPVCKACYLTLKLPQGSLVSNVVQDEEMFCWLWGMWYFACIEIAFLVSPNFPVSRVIAFIKMLVLEKRL